MCLYSAASMLLRRTSAAAHSLSSNPSAALVSARVPSLEAFLLCLRMRTSSFSHAGPFFHRFLR